MSEVYMLGVSSRKVETLVEAMGAKGKSKSEVSRMAAELDGQVSAFRERRLEAVRWLYLWLDALYIKAPTWTPRGRFVLLNPWSILPKPSGSFREVASSG